MLFATLAVDYPILREALSRAPGVEVTWEQSDLTGDGDHRMLVWVDGDDDALEAFDEGLEADPTVAPPERPIEVDDRLFYQIELSAEGRRESVYPLVIEEGTVLREVTATHEGWRFRAAFPGEESLDRFHEFFVDHDVEVTLRRLYDERASPSGSPSRVQIGVTDKQREALVAAVDAGYLDIPRTCSLAELGERLEISSNATSERFRRGAKTLIENTVYSNDRST